MKNEWEEKMFFRKNSSSIEYEPTKSISDALVLLLISWILVITVGSITQLKSIFLGIFITEIFLILLPALLFVKLKRVDIKESFRFRKISFSLALRSAILGVLSWGLVVVIDALVSGLLERIFGENPAVSFFLKILPKTFSELPVFLILFALLPGLCEEILFRGAIQGTLEKKGVWRGILLTSLLFTIYHMNPWGFIHIFIISVIAGFLIIRTNSIISPIIFHACINATAFTIASFLNNERIILYMGIAFFLLLIICFFEFLYKTKGKIRKPSLLINSPPIISLNFKKVIIISGCILTFFTLLVFALFFLLSTFRMTTDVLEPYLNKGDIVVILSNRFFTLNIQEGDVILFLKDGKHTLRRVKCTNENEVTIIDEKSEFNGREARILHKDIRGKMIYKFDLGKYGL